ncbi:hypothetical protein BB560_006892 [Smittium megazygosporum]|uniref:CP-type G domain-containing protein n=1 Tax=Smittium megazygosporum TaxID=133381 RepID=A0A2T9Y0K1_9FUNG|nr:hypothetical protein BB560_006892 [Smittium megazygosporum]
MLFLSLEHKSKRLSGSMKNKIHKRATEKHRKDRKALKNNPRTKKLKKDPGIPSMFPFKEKLLLQIEESKQKAKEEAAAKVLLNKQKQKSLLEGNTSGNSMYELANNASERESTFSKNQALSQNEEFGILEGDNAASGTKDNSRRAYFRDFMKVANTSDVVLFVLDARDPMGTRSKQIEELITSRFNKKLVLVLNKVDLVPKDNLLQWLAFLRKERPTLLFKSNTQQQRSNLGSSSFGSIGSTTETVGGESLLQLLKNYCRNLNIKTAITVGVIGFPNVGKSSLINSLKRTRVCAVGPTPGFTKSVQLIHLDKTIRLLDSPGVVFNFDLNRNSKFTEEQNEICLRNIVKVELLSNPVGPAEVVINRCDQDTLAKKYNVLPYRNATEFLVQLARIRGRFKRGGIPDLNSAARIILTDWNSGKIPYYTMVPESPSSTQSQIKQKEEIEIVSSWGQEFDLNQLYKLDSEITNSLPNQPEVENLSDLTSRKRKNDPSPLLPLSVSVGKELKLDGIELEMDMDAKPENSMSDSDEEMSFSSGEEQVDDHQTSRVVINLNTTTEPENPINKKQKVEKPSPVDLEESLLNPQTNKMNRKNQKKLSKKQNKNNKLERLETPSDNEMGSNNVNINTNKYTATSADSSDEEL